MSKDDVARWEAAAHGVQSGVAMEMNHRSQPTSPKHLRTGLNAAMSDQGGLVTLLIEKGVFTRDEYERAIADAMERERERYEAHLSGLIGANISLR